MFRKMGKKFKTRLRKLTDALLLSSRTEKGEPEEGDPERAPSPVEPERRTKDAGEADAAIESPNPETEAETEAGARAPPEMASTDDLATLLWSALRIPLYQLERDEYGRRGIPMILGLLKVDQLPHRLFPLVLIRGSIRPRSLNPRMRATIIPPIPPTRSTYAMDHSTGPSAVESTTFSACTPS